MQAILITDAEFAQFQRFIFDAAGISMADAKKALVTGRLGKRLTVHGLASFDAYFKLLSSGQHPDEVQMAVDLLTTNETYFFREPKHFEFLSEKVLARLPKERGVRVWSAASSSGEEPYSLVMALHQVYGERTAQLFQVDAGDFGEGLGQNLGFVLVRRDGFRNHLNFSNAFGL